LAGLPQLEEQLIWNDIILLNAIGNERNKWCQLNGIGCNSWTSSIRGPLIWNDIITFNSIENQRKQWYQLQGIGCNSWSSSIGGAIELE